MSPFSLNSGRAGPDVDKPGRSVHCLAHSSYWLEVIRTPRIISDDVHDRDQIGRCCFVGVARNQIEAPLHVQSSNLKSMLHIQQSCIAQLVENRSRNFLYKIIDLTSDNWGHNVRFRKVIIFTSLRLLGSHHVLMVLIIRGQGADDVWLPNVAQEV